MFKGRNLLIATKHEKEKVIAPILEKELGVKCFVTLDFDTDELGTFTGEVERKDDSITTARNKCLMAMELTNCDLAIASEGSFGMHPTIYFAPADDEFLLFIDKKNGLEIIARELSMETNFNGSEIKTEKELQEFATNANFPSHGLILRKSKDDCIEIVKGITDEEELNNTFRHLIAHYGTAYAETDMRAMYNPSRMKVIEKAVCKLVEKIKALCPKCDSPGFGITDSSQGLRCELCNLPTRSTLSYIYTCQKCNYKKEEQYPNGKQTEDPMYCDFCNP
jgi:Zn finger protein HypA/HybF involved in hydrogenase expression